MKKRCFCGQSVHLCLRTVVFQQKVEIENVPIYSCESCGKSGVYASVKPKVTELIGQLGPEPDKQIVRFEDVSEVACLIVRLAHSSEDGYGLKQAFDERVNELLDLLLLAASLGDKQWGADLQHRLVQISEHMFTDEAKQEVFGGS
ncbi:hypothetical protein EDM21_06970 [Paenibacillus sp. N10]|uniref:YgiT-type zinc finger domain-containing protein n=1 Tax=Paenibacillus lutrae TaxID=2078573 RepID=A0A7X3JYQ5_9BACL|nr:hypothetical protein [Paenibacillus lutrae]MVO99271.1 hypothetical protein [Paenibacillus lutrae]